MPAALIRRQGRHQGCCTARVVWTSRGADTNFRRRVAATSQYHQQLTASPVPLRPLQVCPRARRVSSTAAAGAAPAGPEPQPSPQVRQLPSVCNLCTSDRWKSCERSTNTWLRALRLLAPCAERGIQRQG